MVTTAIPKIKLRRAAELKVRRCEDNSLPYVGLENVESKTGRYLEGMNEMPDAVANEFVPGDVLFGKLRPYLAKSLVPDFHGRCSGELLVLHPKGLVSRFLHYWLLSDETISAVSASTYGAKMPRAEWDFIGNLKIPTPPLPTQRRIAAYLDRETARIDSLVAEKEALLRLLEEKRASLISHAVTRGLNPKAKLKPSGIPWLGDVPEHWSVLPLKRVTTTIKTGTTPNTDDVTDQGDFDWYTPGDFGHDIHLAPSKRRIFRESESFDSLRVFPAETILFVGIGATLGKCSVSRTECSANQQINAIVPNRETNSIFLCLSLRAQAEGIRLMANASTIGILNQERTSAIPIAVPPPIEQSAIAAECLRISKATDLAIADIQTSVHLLREKRTSHISAAVTGEMAV
jgi:type I restriction enzyme, S subunit